MIDKSGSAISAEQSVKLENADGVGDIILVAEHAGRELPGFTGSLGLDADSMMSHIAWDIGVAGLATRLSALLDSPLIMQRYSRLVYDCNRALEAPDAIVTESDNRVIPGNLDLSMAHKKQRYEEIYLPFEEAIKNIIQQRRQARINAVIVTVHSFTPVYKGQQRDLDLGVIHDTDTRLADAILDQCQHHSGFNAARNQPYAPEDGVTHTLVTHGVKNGLMNVMLEVRNDLISDDDSRAVWAGRLCSLLEHSLQQISGA